MIRQAQAGDVPAIVALTQSLMPRLKNKGAVFDAASFTAYAESFVAGSPLTKAFVSEKAGELASFIFVFLLHQPLTGETVAMKSLWESRVPGHGRSVLRAAETWARAEGAKRMIAACFEPGTERLLTMLGYSEVEKSFEKVFSS